MALSCLLSLIHLITNYQCTCCLYGAGHMDLDGGNPFLGAFEGVGPEILTFWAQMALATLIPISGPRKVSISGPTLSNAPRYGLLPHPNPYVPPHIYNRCIIINLSMGKKLLVSRERTRKKGTSAQL